MWIKLLWVSALLAVTARGALAPGQTPRSDFDPEPYRARGPEGLKAFLADHGEAVERSEPEAIAALDAVCGQLHCSKSRLFWFTDLEEAKARARAEKKPILSLHLLGRLDEPLSCANSRFFRKLLYADPTISAFLRERYVLHWKTVRPVPKVTVDFGDGRTMVRTLTGNSAHYVLDEQGRPLDVIPGLLSPRAFYAAVQDAAGLSRELRGLDATRRTAALEQWHRDRLKRVTDRWSDDLRAIGQDGSNPTVRAAVQLPLLELATPDEAWDRIAAQHRADHRFSSELRESIAAGAPDAWDSGQRAMTKAFVENPVLEAVRRVEWTVGRDSIRNEYQRHGKVHAWFGHEQVGRTHDLAQLNERVYSELFLAPLSDPWYGLGLPESFEGLDDGVMLGASR